MKLQVIRAKFRAFIVAVATFFHDNIAYLYLKIGVEPVVIDPVAFWLLCGHFGHIEDGDVMSMSHQVEDVEVEKVGVQLEVLAELAMCDGPPIFFGHFLSVVVLDSTSPVVRNFADDVLFLHLLGFKVFDRYIL